AGADLGRLGFVGAIAVDFARSDGPAPDVDLALVVAAQIDAAVAGVVHFHFFLLAGVVGRILAAGHDDRPLHLLRLARQPPIGQQREVAEFLLGPQILVLGFALAVVFQQPVGALPVPLVAGFLNPVV